MPRIACYDDAEVQASRTEEDMPGGHKRWITRFMAPPKGVKNAPTAFLAESTPKRVNPTHFHEVDQFQILVKGGGTLGKHQWNRYGVHYSRPFTPYGPIVNGEEGIAFLTLRAQWDPGAQELPGAFERLTQIKRDPWQVTETADFGGSTDVNVHRFLGIKDDRGLAAYSLRLNAHASVCGPDPSGSGGQHIITVKGSLMYQGKEYKALSIAFLGPDEAPMKMIAGAEGLQAIVLNYPRRKGDYTNTRAYPVVGRSSGYRVWQCVLCAFKYDEAQGMPEEGVPPGTRWEDVPESWTCPDCSASKSDFEMELVG